MAKYIKIVDYHGQDLAKDETILMSLTEFNAGGKDLKGVPICITPSGEEPTEDPNFDI